MSLCDIHHRHPPLLGAMQAKTYVNLMDVVGFYSIRSAVKHHDQDIIRLQIYTDEAGKPTNPPMRCNIECCKTLTVVDVVFYRHPPKQGGAS
jgi:hypothetical protein